MTAKQKIKGSEARIIVYLSIVHNTRKHVTAISNKLDIDYSYVMRILQAMVAKGWLRKHQYRRHMFYDLTEFAPLESVLNEFNVQGLQQNLRDTYSQAELGVEYEADGTDIRTTPQ